MLILKETVRRTYEAAGEELTPDQLEETYDQITQEYDQLRMDFEIQLEKQYAQRTGTSALPSLDRWEMLNMAEQLAGDEIKERWIAPLTQQAIDLMEDEEDEKKMPLEEVLHSPTAWKTEWLRITPRDINLELVDDLWPNKNNSRWEMIAASRLEVLMEQGIVRPTPNDPQSIKQLEREIDHAYNLYVNKHS